MPIPVMMDVVVVELPAIHGAEAKAAIESCELVLGKGRCRAADQPGPAPTFRAQVSFRDAEGLHAHVKIQESDAPASSTERDVVFDPRDSLGQRYRALGLLIVSHVIASNTPVDTTPPPPPVTPERHRWWGLDLAVLGGPGLTSGAARFGGVARGFLRPPFPLMPLVSVGLAHAPSATDATWLEGGLGLALHLPVQGYPFALSLRAEGLAQRVRLHAERDGLTERESIARFGLRAGLDAFVELSAGTSLFVGAQVSGFDPGYRVIVQDEPAGEERGPTWSMLAGVRLTP